MGVVRPLATSPIMAPAPDLPPEASAALAAVGVLVADAAVMPCSAMHAAGVLHGGDPDGIVDALTADAHVDSAAVQAAADALPGPQRTALLAYLLQPGRMHLNASRTATLTSLPLFQAAGESSVFVRIDRGQWHAAPVDVAPAALPATCFVVAPSAATRPQLVSLGVADPSLLAAYASFVLPRLSSLTDATVQQAMLQLLRKLPDLVVHDRGIVDVLSALAFVDTAHGRRAPRDLYDPRIPLLQTLLAGSAHFPVHPYDSDDVLVMLSTLGMQRVVRPETLLQAAEHVEALAGQDPQAARGQGHMLLQYLEVR